MNPNICNNCGGDYEYRNGRWICRACGSYKPEELSNEEVTLLYTASQKLRLADFDEAEQAFDDIIQKYPQNPNGYWGRLMSKYGIKYEEDFDGRRIPTCYATSIESVTSDPDYLAALEYADAENRAYYQNQAEYIERVRLEWVNKARKEKPYDIFICYKDSDLASGIERTWDSVATQDLYIHLSNKGYRVFYSHESLRDKVGEKYEPYIFNALSTAKVMLVYGSKPEYITSTWPKNEWMRYKKRMAAGEKKPNSLLVACDGFAPSELPRALSSMQCLNANKRSFYGDLDEAIDRIIHGKDEGTAVPMSPPNPEEGKKGGRKELGVAALCVVLATAVGVAGWALSRSDPDIPGSESDTSGYVETGSNETEPDETEVPCLHKAMIIPAVEPTCTESGLTEGKRCSLCKTILVQPEAVAPVGHFVAEWFVDQEAEAGVKGNRHGTCMVCGETVYENIRAYSEGLSYTSNGDGTCLVSGIGDCTDPHLRIPPVFEGEQVVGIADNAFSECGQLVQVTLPEGLTTIGVAAFQSCWGLRAVQLPESLTTIGDWAFGGCGELLGMAIPASVREIGIGAFSDCHSMTHFSVAPDNEHFCIIDGVLFNRDMTRLLWYFSGKEDPHYAIPDGVITVDENAFQNCAPLTRLDIPRSVEHIGDGGGGFYGCVGLTEITVDQENEFLCSFDGVLYNKDMTVLKECPSRKASLRIPDSVRTIGVCAFDNCTEMTEIVIPEDVAVIGGSAFTDCRALQRVILPDSVVQIDDWAFANCGAMTTVYYAGTELEWQAIRIGEENHLLYEAEMVYNYVYVDHTHEEVIDEAIEPTCTEDGLTEGKHCAICGAVLIHQQVLAATGHCVEEWTVDREADAETDGLRHGTCLNCGEVVSETFGFYSEGLEFLSNQDGTCLVSGLGECADRHVRIPPVYEGEQVVGLADSAFDGCAELEWITIPEGVTHIGRWAFSGCDALEGIDLPESLTDIADWSFSGCNRLTDLFIPVGVRSISSEAFAGCLGIARFSVDPNNEYYSDRDGVLFDKSGTCLIQYPACREESVYQIPEDVTRIDGCAFTDCSFLTEIRIPASVSDMDYAPIRGACNLLSITVDSSNQHFCSVDGVLLTKDMTRLIAYPVGKDDPVYRAPDGVTELVEWAFSTSRLQEIVISDSVTWVGDLTFVDCPALENITVAEGNQVYCSIDGSLYTKDGTCLLRCPARKTSVEVFHGVCEIGNRAFDGCTELTELTLPYDVTHIGNNAFAWCGNLTRITFSHRVEYIEQDAFVGCFSLQEIFYAGSEEEWQSIRLEGGNETLDFVTVHYHADYGEHEHAERTDPAVEPTCTAFGYTEGTHCSICGEVLTAAQTVMPTGHSVVEWVIDKEAEPGVKGSRHGDCMTCGETVTETIKAYSVGLEYSSNGDGTCTVIGRGGCTDLHVRIPHVFEGERVTSIGEWAFSWCEDIIQVTVPEGVTHIASNAFTGCQSMTLINLPESLTSIGGWAFADCERLLGIYIPSGVEHLDSEALRGCYHLTSISVSPDNPYFCDIDGILFDKNMTCLVRYPTAREGARYEIPQGVTRLGDWAFDDGWHLTELIIPDSVAEIGDVAINACQALAAITVDPNNEYYCSVDGVLFTKDMTCLVRYPIAREGETYSVPEGVTAIGAWAFDATHLTEVFIPASVESIGEWAFHICFELNAITVAEDNPAYCSVDGLLYTKDLSRLIQCPIQKTSVSLPEGVRTIGCRAFEFCGELTEIVVPGDVDRIEDSAFAECQGLTRVVLPDSVVRIDHEAFRGCTALSEIGYTGSPEAWQAVSIDENNEELWSVPVTCYYILVP